MQPEVNVPDETPRSPMHKKVIDTKESKKKLEQFLHGSKLNELPLDFIATHCFGDLYLLDSVLGAGAFGVVLQIVEKSTGQELAMKVSYTWRMINITALAFVQA